MTNYFIFANGAASTLVHAAESLVVRLLIQLIVVLIVTRVVVPLVRRPTDGGRMMVSARPLRFQVTRCSQVLPIITIAALRVSLFAADWHGLSRQSSLRAMARLATNLALRLHSRSIQRL